VAQVPDEMQRQSAQLDLSRAPGRPGGEGSSRWASCLAWLAVGFVLLLVAAYVALIAVFGVHTSRGWIDSSRKTIAPFNKPVVADNGLDVYTNAAAVMDAARASLPLPAEAPLAPAGGAPGGAVPANTWDDVLASALSGMGNVDHCAPVLRANARALALLHEAADRQYVSPVVPSYDTTFPHLAEFRRLARLGAARARYLHQRGQDAEALAVARDVLALGVNMPQHGAMVELLVGDWCIGTAHTQAMPVIEQSRLSAGEYLAHARYLRKLRDRVYPLGKTIELEYHWAKDVAEEVRRRNPAVLADFGWDADDGLEDAARRHVRLALWHPRQSLPWIEDRLARLAEVADAPYDSPGLAKIDGRTEDDVVARNDWFAAFIVPLFGKARGHHARARCSLALEEVAALLAAYRAEHGHYPETLQPLVPEYAKDLPDDPFDGTPFHYERTKTGYRLWSPGMDAYQAARSPAAGATPSSATAPAKAPPYPPTKAP